MPIETRYADQGRGVILTLLGEVTGREFVAVLREIYSRDLAAQPLLYALLDSNGATAVNVATQDLHEIADQDIAAARRMPGTAAVIGIYARDNVTFGLARMWEVFVEESGWETNVFRERSDAVAWLKERVAERFGIEPNFE